MEIDYWELFSELCWISVLSEAFNGALFLFQASTGS